MAIINREVDKALGLLKSSLGPFVELELTSTYKEPNPLAVQLYTPKLGAMQVASLTK